jgi:hypothetical protein
MKSNLFIIFLIFNSVNALANDIQLFNSSVLGASTNQPVLLLQSSDQNYCEPISVSVDTENGFYNAATVVYGREVTIQKVKAALNRNYNKFESEITLENNEYGLWRNTDEKFAIQLTTDEQGDILVIYVSFRNNNNNI